MYYICKYAYGKFLLETIPHCIYTVCIHTASTVVELKNLRKRLKINCRLNESMG